MIIISLCLWISTHNSRASSTATHASWPAVACATIKSTIVCFIRLIQVIKEMVSAASQKCRVPEYAQARTACTSAACRRRTLRRTVITTMCRVMMVEITKCSLSAQCWTQRERTSVESKIMTTLIIGSLQMKKAKKYIPTPSGSRQRIQMSVNMTFVTTK